MADYEQRYDKSSKWMIEHHGDAILRLAGITGITGWRPRPAEVVQPRQWPDGILEVELPGQPTPDYFLLEIATYPQSRVVEQLSRGLLLVYLAKRVVPEVIVLVLRPKGTYEVPGGVEASSRLGTAGLALRWRTVRLWDLKADDVGLVPWIPLTETSEPPEQLIRRCSERIEQDSPPEEKENLYAVTQVMTRLRYNEPGLLTLLGGKKMIIEFPIIREVVDEAVAEATAKALAESKQKGILAVLERRFGPLPGDVAEGVRSIQDGSRLDDLLPEAAACPDIAAFRQTLSR